MMIDAPNFTPRTLYVRLAIAQVASCRCNTKTDEVDAHNDLCPYRLYQEAAVRIATLERALQSASPQATTHTGNAKATLAVGAARSPSTGESEAGSASTALTKCAERVEGPSFADLAEAACELLDACEMEQHNEDIFKGKWKDGSKAWSGEFVAKSKRAAMARVKALVAPPAAAHIATPTCGFDRNGSHSAGHYVCNCGWEDATGHTDLMARDEALRLEGLTQAAQMVFLTRIASCQPDADDNGVEGWLQDAEDAIRAEIARRTPK